MKRAFKMKYKSFIFEGLSLKQISHFFLEGESPTLDIKNYRGYGTKNLVGTPEQG